MIEHDQREDYDDEPNRGPLAPAHIVSWPASIMWVFGLLQLIITQLCAISICSIIIVSDIIDRNKPPGELWDEAKHNGEFWIFVIGWAVATTCTILVMRGASDLKRFRRYPWVVAGAILTLLSIPFFYLAVIQLPLGIWLLWLLLRRDVRARFEAVARADRNTSENKASGAA